MKKILIFTNFFGDDEAFSICNVVNDQIKMLILQGYEPIVVVSEGFVPKRNFAHEKVKLIYLPTINVDNSGRMNSNYIEDKEKVIMLLNPLFNEGMDIVITHDIIYRPDLIIFNIISRELAKNYPNVRWLHWIHSATSAGKLSAIEEIQNEINRPFPNSFICYPNAWDIPRVARNFGYEEDYVKVVPHPTDFADFFGFDDTTEMLFYQKGLYNADVINVYPCRLDRGKQPHFNINLIKGLKNRGLNAKSIIVDFHSTGGDKVAYREEMKFQAQALGLTQDDIIFTSEFNEKWKSGVPHSVVRNLFNISNVFMLPSRSETYSLVTQEAGLTGNLLILNFDFPAMRSIYADLAIYKKFSSNVDAMQGTDGETNTSYKPDAQAYFNDIAAMIHYYLEHDKALKAKTILRKERNLISIFKNHIEPLFFYEN